jgi:hypothetical protein
VYKKLLNAKPFPDGSPEHVHWTAAAVSRKQSAVARHPESQNGGHCITWHHVVAAVENVRDKGRTRASEGGQHMQEHQHVIGFQNTEIAISIQHDSGVVLLPVGSQPWSHHHDLPGHALPVDAHLERCCHCDQQQVH